MEKQREQLFCLALVCALALGATSTSAQNPFGVLHSFTNAPNDGANPEGQPILIASNLFGVTFYGGANSLGAVYQVCTNGTNYNVIYSFDGDVDGANPFCTLAASGPFFYGMTFNGGVADGGVVFRVRTNGTYSVLHTFMGGNADGLYPFGSVIVTNGTLFGMTSSGGTNDDGVVFKVGTNITGFAVLHSFQGGTLDGSSPSEGVTLGGTNLFGTTFSGGSNNLGIVFSMVTNGASYSILHHFGGPNTNSDGANPSGPLTLSGSTLYGITTAGGPTNAGTVFKINTDGSGYAVLHSFSTNTTDGAYPQFGPLLVTNSLIYGVTENGGSNTAGVVFQITTNGTGFTILHSFLGGTNDGAFPDWPPIMSGSSFYGTTIDGGISNAGVVYGPTAASTPTSQIICLDVPALSETGVAAMTITAGLRYAFTASGTASFNCSDPTLYVDANGNPWGGDYVDTNRFHVSCAVLFPMSLVGVVNGTCIQLGTSGSFVAPTTGELFLHMNDTPGGYFNNCGSWHVCISPGDFRITTIATTNANDITLTWLTTGGFTNAVQATPGDAQGNFNTNGFTDLSGSIVIAGSGSTTTNYTDVGGATNYPCRYYRIRIVP